MKAFRLNRIFEYGSGRFFGVAFEKYLLDSYDILSGLQIMQSVSAMGLQVVQAGVSEALAWRGVTTQGGLLLDVGDAEAISVPRSCASLVDQALRLDATGIAISLSDKNSAKDYRAITVLKEQCDRYELPLLMDISKVRAGSRSSPKEVAKRAVGLGADIIKADLRMNQAAIRQAAQGALLVASISSEEALEDAALLGDSAVCGLILEQAMLDKLHLAKRMIVGNAAIHVKSGKRKGYLSRGGLR